MGEARRRKKLDPNYGKSKTVDFENMVSNLLLGETLLLCSRIEDESGRGGDTFLEIKISEIAEDDKQSNIKLASEIATQANIIKLGIRRQHEQGRGLLNFMDEKYRKLTGLYTSSDGSGIVFNWYTVAEIKTFQRGSALSAILLALAIGCNTTYQFPCLFSGVPLDENATSRCHLLFIGSGAIESLVRQVVNLRMKGNSKFWLKENAEIMLHLRCQWVAGSWNNFCHSILASFIKPQTVG